MEWYKFYGRKWLLGTIRMEMTREQMSVFTDLMCMCSMCKESERGVISRGDGIPFELSYISQFIECPMELLQETIRVAVATGRMIVEPNGIIRIIKWEVMQLSPTDKVHKRKQVESNTARQQIAPATPLVLQSRLDKNAVEMAKTNRPKVIESLIEDDYKIITPDGEVLDRKKVENENGE